MRENTNGKNAELLCVIVNNGLGSKVLKTAKHNGITGGTIFLARGTVKNRILELLDMYDIRKEIVLMIAEKMTAFGVLEKLNHEMHFNKPNHGIAFSIDVSGIIGAICNKPVNTIERGVDNAMYHAIFTIVDKGRAEEAVEAAVKAGARGGTVINARGSGIHETSKLFSMEIEPEKEIVLILSEERLTDSIVSAIKDSLRIEEPGNGIIFILDAGKTYGLYE